MILVLKKISGHASSGVSNVSELLISLSSTMICRIVFRRRYDNDDEGSDASRFHDYIPFTGWIDKLKELHARLEGSFKELDNFYQEIIDEHRDQNRQHAEEKDIVDVMLQLKNESSLAFDLTFDHIKGVLMSNFSHKSFTLVYSNYSRFDKNILAAGTDTTAATSVWAMTALVKNHRVMKKVQEEVRNVGGTKDFLDEDDIQKLPYFKAMIKETLRLHLPSQLLIPRESTEECIVDGYRIPAKTIVYVNAWVIQRDPEVWKNPEEFCPERFLDSAIDFRGQDFELIPFGAGRRICPGIPMAAVILELVLANLLHSFDWKLPQGMVKEDIDVEVLPGITQHKKNHLCLHLYVQLLNFLIISCSWPQLMLLPLVLCLALPVLFMFFIQNLSTLIKKPPHPPGPKGLPIIGNLHQLDNSILCLQLWQLSKKYDLLFSLQLGLRPAIVISSPKLAKKVLKNHDLEFCGRPKLLAQQKLSYNGSDIVFSPYNEYWREIRKVSVVHIFSSKRVCLYLILY
ncbi:Cytochrome P450 71A9 [Glycine soja]